jgi:hypothetical protein
MPNIWPLLHKQERGLITDELLRAASAAAQCVGQFAIAFAADQPIDRVALTRALNATVLRHASLRTIIVPSSRYGETVRQMQLQTFARTGLYVPGLYEQHVCTDTEVQLQERTCAGDTEELAAIASEECASRLDLTVAPVLRATLIAGRPRQLVVINLSHLMLDLWSTMLLHHEISHAYGAFVAGASWELQPVLQQHDLVAEEIDMLRSPEGARHLAYWSEHYESLGDAPIRASELPFTNRHIGPLRFDMLGVRLSEAETRQVHTTCGGRPDYAFWRTMYGIALGIFVNRTRVAFWANFFNRRRPGAQSVLAWCAHPHQLIVDAPWSLPWAEVRQRVRSGVRQAQAHETYSQDSVALGMGSTVGTTDTRLTFDVIPGHSPYADAPLQPVAVRGMSPQADLGFRIYHINDTYTLTMTFNSGRYQESGVRRLLSLMHDTIRACITQPAANVGDIVRDVRKRQRVEQGLPVSQ